MATTNSNPARRAHRRPDATGLVAALDWLEVHHARRANIWAKVGGGRRTRPEALIASVRALGDTDIYLWSDIELALAAITDEITRRLRGDS